MFSDVAIHWASACITALAARGLVSGYPNGTFRPNGALTRAEFASLMTRVFTSLPEKQAAAEFRDVTGQYWASSAIAWVSQRGLFSGYGDGSFRPTQAISRVQAIIVLVQGLKAELGAGDTADVPQLELMAQQFSDAQTIPTWAQGTVSTALEINLLEPLPDPRPLLPNQSISRGEVAALICRAMGIPLVELKRENAALAAAQNQQVILQQFTQQEAGVSSEKLPYLNRGIERSPYKSETAQFALRLKTFSQPSDVVATSVAGTTEYPIRGVLPAIDAKGLDFLSADMLAGCLCLSTLQGNRLRARWLGKIALNNREMRSATKFVPLLNVIDRANAIAPETPISRCEIRKPDSQSGYPFYDLAAGIFTDNNRISNSDALAVMFKNFETPARLESWLRALTGNTQLSFRGRYGEMPFIQSPQLWDTQTGTLLLKSAEVDHLGKNLVSPYDLTRLLTMAAWHYQLSKEADINQVKGHSLEPMIRAMGQDPARYVDAAIEKLGLTADIRNLVIISKSGFGRSDLRDRTELTYCAHVQFALPRAGAPDPTAPYQQ